MRATDGPRRSKARLVLLASTSLVILAATAAPVSFEPAGGWTVKTAEAGKCCFVAGTKVRMADGSERPIESLRPGDRVMGRGGRANRVLGLVRTRLGRRRLWSINGSRPFVTAEHPFLAEDGWRAIEPEATFAENPGLEVRALRRGDRLVRLVVPAAPVGGDGTARQLDAAFVEELEVVRVLMSVTAHADFPLFNLELDGDHTYVADGWVVHNKGGDGGGSSGHDDDDDDDDQDEHDDDDHDDDDDRDDSSEDDDEDDDHDDSSDDDDEDDDRDESSEDDDEDDEHDDSSDDDDEDDDRDESSEDDDEDEDDDASDDEHAAEDEEDDDRAVAAASRSGATGGAAGTSLAGRGGNGDERALTPAEERALIARGWR